MAQRTATAASLVVALVLSWGCGRPPDPAPQVAGPPDPSQLLRGMFDTLAQARQLTFKATRHLDPSLVLGGIVAESTAIEVWVSRPQMLRARSVTDAGVRLLYADGQRVSLFDEAMKVYATAPLNGTIDDVVNALDARYGFTPPLAEFILNDPAAKFSAQIQSSVYQGRETVDGLECDRLTLHGEIADADLWIAVRDRLPRRFVATFKDREGSPQLTVDFSEWNLAAALDASAFAFEPPKDAEKIQMTTVDDAAASGAKDGAQ